MSLILSLIKSLVGFGFDLDGHSSQNSYNDPACAGEVEADAQKIPTNGILKISTETPVHTAWDPGWPTGNPRVTLKYGKRRLNGRPYNHKGLDMVSGKDAAGKELDRSCFTPCPGTVKKIVQPDRKYPNRTKPGVPKGRGWTPRLGYIANLPGHDWDKAYIVFKHLDPAKAPKAVKAGDKLGTGIDIGDYADLGYSFGAHLHYEVWKYHENKVYVKAWKKWSHWPTPSNPKEFQESIGKPIATA